MEAMLTQQRLAEETPGRFVQIVGNTPASYFGMVLGLAGLGNAWRGASRAWQLPEFIAEWIYVVAGVVWAALLVLYILKAIFAPAKLMEEAAHPVQCCFIGLAGVATMLIAGGLVPHSQVGASILFALGFIFTLLFAVWRTGGLWKGERDHAATTAVLYLPTVAGSFVLATVVSALGYPDWGQFAFGAGIFSWLAVESVLLHRLLTGPTKAVPLRPTLGIQLAPAPVGAVAYIAISGGVPDIFVHALIGYGILQLLVMARLSPWIAQAGAVPVVGVQFRSNSNRSGARAAHRTWRSWRNLRLRTAALRDGELGYRRPHRHDAITAVIRKDVRLASENRDTPRDKCRRKPELVESQTVGKRTMEDVMLSTSRRHQFSRRGFCLCRDMLVAIRGNVAALKAKGGSLDDIIKAKPTAVFDAKWGQFVIDPGFFTRLVYEGV
jgi:tellurite resistance protein